MDAGIANTINRGTVRLIALHLDDIDEKLADPTESPWYRSSLAATLMGENAAARDADRAWLIGQLANNAPGLLGFDGPADEDWDNLLSNFRTEILSRRDSQTPPVQDQPLCEMV